MDYLEKTFRLASHCFWTSAERSRTLSLFEESTASGRRAPAFIGWLPIRVSFVLLVAVSCASSQRVLDLDLKAEIQWPHTNPRVRLARVIGDSDSLRPGSLARLITGPNQVSIFNRPFDLAWRGDDLLVVDAGARRVIRISQKNRVTKSQDGDFEGPVGIEVCAEGILVTDSRAGSVKVLDDDLRVKGVAATGLDRPTGIACRNGYTFVAETGKHRIVSIHPDGSRKELGGRGNKLGEFNFPTLLASHEARMWVGDTLNFRVQQLEPASGSFLSGFGALGDAAGEMPRMKGLAADNEGNIWLSDAYLDQVAIYSPDGTFLLSIGARGAKPGQFNFPAGIAVSQSGRIAVADSLNRRVQIFEFIATTSEPHD